MVRRRRIKHLFAVVTTITLLGIIIIIIELVHKARENERRNRQTDINITWQSAHHNDQSTACYTSTTISTLSTGSSLVADGVTNGSLNAREFLVEYEKYCSTQLIPKSSNVVVVTATATPVSRSLCPCVPHTLGKQ